LFQGTRPVITLVSSTKQQTRSSRTSEKPEAVKIKTDSELNSVSSKLELGRNQSKTDKEVLSVTIKPETGRNTAKSETQVRKYEPKSTSKLSGIPESEPRIKAIPKVSTAPKPEPKVKKSSTPKQYSSVKLIDKAGTKRKSTGLAGNCERSKLIKLEDENENLKFVIKLAKQDVRESKDQKNLTAKFEDYKTRLLSLGGNLNPENSTLEQGLSRLDLQILNLERDFKNLKKSNRQCKKEDWSHLTPSAINEKKRKILELIRLNV